ncbi:MAG: hypothetical protein ACI9YT_001487 [Halobacteriales archaeon]
MVLAFAGTYLGGTPEPGEESIGAVKWWREHPETLVYEGLREVEIPAADEETEW